MDFWFRNKSKEALTYKLISRTGGRQNNEDCVGMHQVGERYGFFLADGLGGHGKGEVASNLAVKQAILQFEAGECSSETLSAIFEAGQRALLDRQRQEGSTHNMKTTLTALLVDRQAVRWGHIGDSRVYYFQNCKLAGRTLDHSVPQMLAAAGEIREQEIRHHPDRNRLLHVMGAEWTRQEYQLAEPVPRRGRQAFLLCSDGFWELVDETEMTALLRRADTVERWLNDMEELVKRHGAGSNMDNYSAIAVWSDG